MKVWGVAEIGKELGVRPATVSQWVARGKLPEPDERLSMGPVWLAATIEPWIREQQS